MSQSNVHFTQRLEVGMLLAAVGGFLDAYTFLCRGGVFATAQTGNIVQMGMGIAQKNLDLTLLSLLSILAFMAGTLVAEFLMSHNRVFHIKWYYLVLLLELAITFGIGFVPTTVPHTAVNITVSFVSALQVSSFRTLIDTPYATTMSTGNLRSAMSYWYQGISKKDHTLLEKSYRYFKIIISFCVGAALGAILTERVGSRSVWLCCIFLLAVLFLFFHARRLKKKAYRAGQ